MHHKSLYSSKIIARILNDKLLKRISTRYASTGLNLWEHDLSPDVKHDIEKHWKYRLGKYQFDDNDTSKEKFYVLSMFPYPSGQLHMGHVRVYSISDSVARFHRMKGKNVLHPMGWDAFGLPAENAAIERGLDPSVWTIENILKMREQMERLGCSFDWEYELTTCDPDYYKWTQELFLKLFDNDLVYRKEALVNWDPVDQTVLADEQVDANGCSWRSGAKVEKKILNQWFVKTTAYAKSLYDGLSDPVLKEWRDVINLQKHWIGECNGVSIDFELVSDDPRFPKTITLWTQTPEMIEEAKFVAFAPGSFLDKIDQPKKWDDVYKRLNASAINPINKKVLPLLVTDKVEFEPFADSRIGIPASSDSDAEFCAVLGIDFETMKFESVDEIEEKRNQMLNRVKELNVGRYPVSSKLRDWLISRQRYWGTPIPIVHCNKCGAQPVARDQLPVLLPKLDGASKTGISPLEQAHQWLETNCPKCGGEARRETDTMDTFVDSSWYFMRYIDRDNKRDLFSKEKAERMLPVDLYVGGKEHAVLHLYYARFISHFLHSQGLLPTREPFKQLLVQGMVMGRTYRIKHTGKYLNEDEVVKGDGNNYVHKESGKPIVCSWEKMSKSRCNGVDPSDMFSKYGTDMTRLIILADVAPTSNRNWSPATFHGIAKWQNRLWLTLRDFVRKRKELSSEQLASRPEGEQFREQEAALFDSRNYYVKGVTRNIIDTQQLSVAISKMQGLTNSIRKSVPEVIGLGREYERTLAAQIIMLAPLAPHFASELWSGFCSAPRISHGDRNISEKEVQWDKDVLQQNWPEVDIEYKLDLNVLINGREIMVIKVPRHRLDKMTREEATELVTNDARFQEYVGTWRVINATLYSEEGCDANINVTTVKPTEESKLQESQV